VIVEELDILMLFSYDLGIWDGTRAAVGTDSKFGKPPLRPVRAATCILCGLVSRVAESDSPRGFLSHVRISGATLGELCFAWSGSSNPGFVRAPNRRGLKL
jgi:hypothetical protein